MKHLHYGQTEVKAVPDAWLPATAAATQYIIKISGKRDTICQLGPGFAASAGTAQYTPHMRLIEADTNVMLPGVRPVDVDFNDELFSARHPLLKGALIHEAAHRRYSRWVPADLVLLEAGFTAQMIDVLVLLEESRIEKRILRRHPAEGFAHLPAIVFDLLARGEFKVSESPYGASVSAALILARVDAGTITVDQAEPFYELISAVLDDDTLRTLRDCWRRYQGLMFPEDVELPVEAMLEIARAWLEAIGIDPDQAQESPELAAGGAGEGDEAEGGEGSGEGSGKPGEAGAGKAGGEAGDAFAKALAEAAAEARHEQDMDAADKVGEIKVKRHLEERAADEARHEEGKEAEEAAFGGHGFGKGGKARIVKQRKPEPAEVGAAGIFAKKLERVIYTDKRVVKINTDRPGGRLRGRAAMANDAAVANGMQPDAKMWRQRKMTVTDEPTIRVGLAVDISGSMKAAEEPMGMTSYIVGNGVQRADGVFASVVFGERIHGVVRPGQKIDSVPVVAAEDGSEAFKDAFLALDSMLNLLDGDGVKILVLASDGMFVDHLHAKYADTAMRLCEKRGVLVLHLDFDNGGVLKNATSSYNPRHGNKALPLPIAPGTSPQDVAALVGDRLIAEVRKLQVKRAA